MKFKFILTPKIIFIKARRVLIKWYKSAPSTATLKGFSRGLLRKEAKVVAIFRSVANDDLHRFCYHATHLPKSTPLPT